MSTKRGFALLSPEKKREISSMGGRASGPLVSQNREHMQAIGRRGGLARAKKEAESKAVSVQVQYDNQKKEGK